MPNNYFSKLNGLISYHKNQLGIRLDERHMSRKVTVANVNRTGGSGLHSEPLSKGFRGQSPLRKFLGSK